MALKCFTFLGRRCTFFEWIARDQVRLEGQSGFFDELIRILLLKDAAAPKLLGCAGPRTKAAGKAAFLMACPQGGAGWLGEKKPGTEVNKLPRNVQGALVNRIKILSNLKIDERRVPQDGRFKIK